MAWRMTGRWLETCSCKMICRCTMGPAEPDQGWCSAAILVDIQQGESEGVSLGNTPKQRRRGPPAVTKGLN